MSDRDSHSGALIAPTAAVASHAFKAADAGKNGHQHAIDLDAPDDEDCAMTARAGVLRAKGRALHLRCRRKWTVCALQNNAAEDGELVPASVA